MGRGWSSIKPTLGERLRQGLLNVKKIQVTKNLKVIYHPLYSMNKFVTNKSKLPQDGAQVSPYMG